MPGSKSDFLSAEPGLGQRTFDDSAGVSRAASILSDLPPSKVYPMLYIALMGDTIIPPKNALAREILAGLISDPMPHGFL